MDPKTQIILAIKDELTILDALGGEWSVLYDQVYRDEESGVWLMILGSAYRIIDNLNDIPPHSLIEACKMVKRAKPSLLKQRRLENKNMVKYVNSITPKHFWTGDNREDRLRSCNKIMMASILLIIMLDVYGLRFMDLVNYVIQVSGI